MSLKLSAALIGFVGLVFYYFFCMAASIATLDSFFIRKISLIKFELQLVSKLKT
jgi:hypothetical protein